MGDAQRTTGRSRLRHLTGASAAAPRLPDIGRWSEKHRRPPWNLRFASGSAASRPLSISFNEQVLRAASLRRFFDRVDPESIFNSTRELAMIVAWAVALLLVFAEPA